MRETMEKNTNISKENDQLFFVTGGMVLVAAILYLISSCVGGAFYDFCKAAIVWILMGIGVACATSYASKNESNEA